MRNALQQVSRRSVDLLRTARHLRLAPGIGAPRSRRRAGARVVLLAVATALAVGLSPAGGAPGAALASSAAATLTTRAAESTDGLIHITLTPGASEARYVMQVRTLGQPPKPAVCTTREVGGQIVLTPEGGVVSEQSLMTVDQRTLRCAPPLRDDMAQQLLQTAQHPTSTFIARSAPGLPVPLTPGQQNYQMIGDQIVRGITRSVTYDTAGSSTTETFVGTSRAVLKMSDFGIVPPKIGPLISVEDEMTAEVDIRADISAPPMPAAEAPALPEGESPAP